MSKIQTRIDWKRYIGEITVIVIGVLIAFAVDNWRIFRVDRALEREYLNRLVADLQGDAENFKGIIDSLKRKEGALHEIAPFVRGKNNDIPDKEKFLRSVTLGGSMGLSRSNLIVKSMFEDLVSTGNLRLLRDTHLRANLVKYYKNSENSEDRIMARHSGYALYVHKLLPAELRDKLDRSAMEEFGVNRALSRFRSPEFEDLLNQEINFMLFFQRTLEFLTADTGELLELLETELEK